MSGKFLNVVEDSSIYTRTQPFLAEKKPNDSIEKSFKKFLKSSGLEKLMPVNKHRADTLKERLRHEDSSNTVRLFEESR